MHISSIGIVAFLFLVYNFDNGLEMIRNSYAICLCVTIDSLVYFLEFKVLKIDEVLLHVFD
jgi:hypothetical protein